MTYRNCKRLIEITEKNGGKTEAWKEDMANKLDVFLLNGRLTDEEYSELLGLLGKGKSN